MLPPQTPDTLLGLRCFGWMKDRDFTQRFARQVGYWTGRGGVADRKENKCLFVGWPLENLTEKSHGARCVGKGSETHSVQGGDEDAARESDTLLRVVVLAA